MRISDLPIAAKTMSIDVVLINVHLAKALEEIDKALPGFPAGTDGGSGDDGSITERVALAPLDRGRSDLTKILRLMDASMRNTHDLAALLRSWAMGTVDGTSILAKGLGDLYCPNCVTHGDTDELKGEGRKHCTWCDGVQREYGKLPNQALYDKRKWKQRLTQDDYERALGVKRRNSAA